jgi:hypothetical protein
MAIQGSEEGFFLMSIIFSLNYPLMGSDNGRFNFAAPIAFIPS